MRFHVDVSLQLVF